MQEVNPIVVKASRSPRIDRVAARRRQLVELTMQLVQEKGFADLSVNELAERASMSVGGLYRYIKTKSDLLEMICDEINLDVDKRMAEAASEVRGVAEKLHAGFKVYWDACWEAAEPILMAYREWQSMPEAARQRYIAGEARISQFFSDLIRAGVAAEEFRAVDARLLATEMIMLAQLRAVKGWALRGVSRSEIFAEHWELIIGRLRVART